MASLTDAPRVGDYRTHLRKEQFNEIYGPSDVRLYGRPATQKFDRGKLKCCIVSILAEDSQLKDTPISKIDDISNEMMDYIMEYLEQRSSPSTKKYALDAKIREQILNCVVFGGADGGEDEPSLFSIIVPEPSLEGGKDGGDGSNGEGKGEDDGEDKSPILVSQVLSIRGRGEYRGGRSKPPFKSLGVIYGYSYEGHAYRLPKPLVMMLPVRPMKIVDGDSGYDPKLGFAVWRLDKSRMCVSLDVRDDTIETIILDENLPGKRSPLTYAQNYSLSPNRVSHE